MTNIYVYVMDTMADWEVASIMAECNSRRFFRKDAREVFVHTVSVSKDPVCTMGGLTILPDLTVDEIRIDKEQVLLLPGSDQWNDPEHAQILAIAELLFEQGGLIAAICGATVALAGTKMLSGRKHTSNGAGFLEMFCPSYRETAYYVDAPAVRDENLITAAGTGALEMAELILEYLDVFREETLKHWYGYFRTGDANEFFALMQSIQ